MITRRETTFELVGIHKNGSKVHLEMTARDYPYNGRNARIVLYRDITTLKEQKKEIEFKAYHDELTGLPNRTLFNRRLTLAMSRVQLNNKNLAVLLLDLDGFKKVNDTLTHNVGDKLIQQVAERLNECVMNEDTVCRFGGDEFQILLHQANESGASKVAERILEAFKEPFMVEGYQLHMTTSIGISMYPKDGESTEQLIKNADTAMYECKRTGKKHYEFYKQSLSHTMFYHLSLENELRASIDNNELLLNYQPQVNLKTGEIFGVEALSRWQHNELGFISPGEFIPIAERTGIIMDLGDWVLYTACLQNKIWQEKGYAPITIAVNISTKQFYHPDFIDKIRTTLKETKLEPKYLHVEITENIAIENQEWAIERLKSLKEMGIKVHIDDFGTGFSSFNYLKKFPIHKVKIDKSFIQDIPKNTDNISITKAIIAMATNMGLDVIAEGVETKEQVDFLTEFGCKQVQGFYFSKPLPGDEFEELLKKNHDQKSLV